MMVALGCTLHRATVGNMGDNSHKALQVTWLVVSGTDQGPCLLLQRINVRCPESNSRRMYSRGLGYNLTESLSEALVPFHRIFVRGIDYQFTESLLGAYAAILQKLCQGPRLPFHLIFVRALAAILKKLCQGPWIPFHRIFVRGLAII